MISVVFLVCNLMSGECYSITEPQAKFQTHEQCKTYALDIIATQTERVLRGELEPFQAEFQCISWDKA
jgi:hypothetical protein